MTEYREVQHTITVPKGAGIDGYLEAIRTVLKRPRVQEVQLKANGTVTYKRFALEGEPEDPEAVELETLLPYHVLKNIPIEEFGYEIGGIYETIRSLFNNVAADGLAPIGFTSGDAAPLPGARTLDGSIYGYPLWVDSNIPRETLILFGAFTRESSLIGARKAYKITLPVTTR